MTDRYETSIDFSGVMGFSGNRVCRPEGRHTQAGSPHPSTSIHHDLTPVFIAMEGRRHHLVEKFYETNQDITIREVVDWQKFF